MKSQRLHALITLLSFFLISNELFAQSELWGITKAGGTNSKGVLFVTSSDGTNLQVKKNFDGSIFSPVNGLILASNGKVYGVAQSDVVVGFNTVKAGAVFEYNPANNQLAKKLELAYSNVNTIPGSGLLEATNGKLYGVMTYGGDQGQGIIYEYNTATGTGSKKFEFQTSGFGGGVRPAGNLVQAANGNLYGTTTGVGQTGAGAIFEYNITTNTYTLKYSFVTANPNDYSVPSNLFLGSDGNIYGIAKPPSPSVPSGKYDIFKYVPGSTGVSVIYTSVYSSASPASGTPVSNIINATNGKWYGTSLLGGLNDNGVLFEYDINTNTLTKKIDFASATTGASPGKLIEAPNGKLYGMTESGGASNKGTLFEFDPATDGFVKATDFSGTNGTPSGNSLLVISGTPQNQTITFNALPTKYVGNSTFLLDATSSSGLAVSYTSSDPTVASISGNTVTILKEGTITITASQAGNSGYNAAPEVQQTLTVLRTNQTITFPSISTATYGGAAIQLNATSTSGLAITYATADPNIATISGTKVVLHNAGTTTITASQAGNTVYYAAADAQQSITINKAQQTISFSSLPDKNINDTPFNLNATASSTLPVVFSSTSDKISITSSTVTLLKAGRASITASQSGNANYEAAAVVEQSFCIKPARPELSLSSSSGVATLTSNASMGNQWYFNGTLISGQSAQTLTLNETGIYKVKVKIDDCESEFSTEVSFVLSKAEQSIQFNSISDKAVNDQPFSISATATSGASVIFSSASDKISLAANQVTILKAGRASITASQPGNSSYLAATPVSQSFCIKPATAQVSISTINGLTILTSNVVNGNQWYFNGNVISGQTAQTLLITQSGIYKVKVTVDDCSSDFSSDTNAVITAIEDYNTSSIALFPNPASDAITLSFGNVPGKKSVSVYQLDGKVKLTKEYWGNEGVLSITDYSPGVYFVKVISSNSNAVLKFIKK